MAIKVPADKVPSDPAERHAFLRRYFCDKDAVYNEKQSKLTLSWSADAERYVDPLLVDGLEWWGGGTKFSKMSEASRRKGIVLTALNDTWTLYSWSKWVKRRKVDPHDPLTILHVDDHFDIDSPRLLLGRTGLTDAITGKSFDIFDPPSVRRAILSGAIGMGSFLTPFLYAFPGAEVRHLRQPPKTTRTQAFAVNVTTFDDYLIAPGAERPAVNLGKSRKKSGPGTYTITSKTSDWLKGVCNGPVLLHIDMDYFNNRFDGDSDWKQREKRLDPGSDQVLNEVMRVFSALIEGGVFRRIQDVVVAFSPGFFPAELWARSGALVDRLLHHGAEFSPASLSESTATRPIGRDRQVNEEDVLLVRTRGTQGRGGGPGGESWRIEVDGRRAGTVFINCVSAPRIGEHASVQVFLNAKSQGRHIGRAAFRKACLLSQYELVYAHIRKSNVASIRAALGAGFVDVTPVGWSQLLFAWRLSSSINLPIVASRREP